MVLAAKPNHFGLPSKPTTSSTKMSSKPIANASRVLSPISNSALLPENGPETDNKPRLPLQTLILAVGMISAPLLKHTSSLSKLRCLLHRPCTLFANRTVPSTNGIRNGSRTPIVPEQTIKQRCLPSAAISTHPCTSNSSSRTKPSRPQQGGSKKFGPLSQEEKDRHRRNNLCSYCGGQNHFADWCLKRPNRPSFSPRQNVSRVRGAQLNEAHFTEEDNNDQFLEEGEIPDTPTVSRLYHEPASIYDLDIPDPDPDSQDFY